MQPEPAVQHVLAGPDSEGWWAIYTKHQHEKVAAEILAAKGAEVFLPVYLATRRWKDRRVKLSVPLFPCYLASAGGVDSLSDGRDGWGGDPIRPESSPSARRPSWPGP